MVAPKNMIVIGPLPYAQLMHLTLKQPNPNPGPNLKPHLSLIVKQDDPRKPNPDSNISANPNPRPNPNPRLKLLMNLRSDLFHITILQNVRGFPSCSRSDPVTQSHHNAEYRASCQVRVPGMCVQQLFRIANVHRNVLASYPCTFYWHVCATLVLLILFLTRHAQAFPRKLESYTGLSYEALLTPRPSLGGSRSNLL